MYDDEMYNYRVIQLYVESVIPVPAILVISLQNVDPVFKLYKGWSERR